MTQFRLPAIIKTEKRLNMSDYKLTMIIVGVIVSIVLFGALFSRPTKYESYNEAIVHCSHLKGLNAQNACRAEVTRAYRYDD